MATSISTKCVSPEQYHKSVHFLLGLNPGFPPGFTLDPEGKSLEPHTIAESVLYMLSRYPDKKYRVALVDRAVVGTGDKSTDHANFENEYGELRINKPLMLPPTPLWDNLYLLQDKPELYTRLMKAVRRPVPNPEIYTAITSKAFSSADEVWKNIGSHVNSDLRASMVLSRDRRLRDQGRKTAADISASHRGEVIIVKDVAAGSSAAKDPSTIKGPGGKPG